MVREGSASICATTDTRTRSVEGCIPTQSVGTIKPTLNQALSNPTLTTPLSIARCTNSACELICNLFFTRVW